jgi:hypothetical protein
MLSIQKSPTDKTGLGYVTPSSDAPSTSKTVFVKPTVPEPPSTAEDKGKDKVNDDVPSTQCSLLKAQKAKAKKEVPRQADHGTRPAA